MKSKDESITNYAQMGRAALLPGMQFMMERMQNELDEMRAMLHLAEPAGKVGRPRKKASSSGWSSDPEERKREMARRFAVREAKKQQIHKAKSEGAKTRWKKMSKTARANWMSKMAAGKRKAEALRRTEERATKPRARAKQRVNGVLAATAVETRREAVA